MLRHIFQYIELYNHIIFYNSSQVSMSFVQLTFNKLTFLLPPHTHMSIDGESWNLRNQGWEGCQNLLTQLNQLQYESSNCSTVSPWWGHVRALEAASAIFQQWRPSEALLGSSPSPLEPCRTSLHIHRLFPEEVEGALICAWVSLSLVKTSQATSKNPFCMISYPLTFPNVHFWILSSVSGPSYSVVALPHFFLLSKYQIS